MYFPNIITIIIPRPFLTTVTNGGVSAFNRVITGVFIGIDVGIGMRKVFNMVRQVVLIVSLTTLKRT